MANRFWVNTGGGTWDNSTTSNWSTTSGGSSGASVPGASDTAIFDNNSGSATVTTNYNASLTGLTLDATNLFAGTLKLGGTLSISGGTTLIGSGSFDTQGNNVTSSLSSSNSNTRSITLGATTWTLSATSGTILNFATATSLTLTPGSSTFQVTGSGSGTRTLSFGGVAINNLSVTNGTGTLNLNTMVLNGNLDFTGFGGSYVPQVSTSVKGNVTLSSTMTYASNSNTWTWAATSGTVTMTSNTASFGSGLTVDGVGGTFTFADTFTSVRAITHTNGTLNSAGKTLKPSAFNSNNSNNRTLTLDSSLIQLSGVGTISNMSTQTGLTLSCLGTTWEVTDTTSSTKSLNWGTNTYGSLTIDGASGCGAFTTTGPNPSTRTFTNITLNPYVAFLLGTSANNEVIVTGSLSAIGVSGQGITIQSATGGTPSKLTLQSGATQNLQFVTAQDVNSGSGITVYDVISGTNNGNNTNWAFSLGGTLPMMGV